MINIILHVDGVPVGRHTLHDIRAGDQGFYRSVLSLSAFSKRENTILYKNNLKGSHFTLGKRCSVYFEKDRYWWNSMGFSLVAEHHQTVWDFYKAIGYDYKKKRYLK